MKNKSFIILWMTASAMVIGVMIENTQNISAPEKVKVAVDSNEIKNKIQKSGIIPHEAKYWKEL